MNTSVEATKKLQDAAKMVKEAQKVIDNLLAPHDYQDVASLVSQAAAAMLESATLFMEKHDEDALAKIEEADNLVEAMYDIIEGDLDEE
jgi:vacuolar-type H+-ATPase subunit E/Vma4